MDVNFSKKYSTIVYITIKLSLSIFIPSFTLYVTYWFSIGGRNNQMIKTVNEKNIWDYGIIICKVYCKNRYNVNALHTN